MISTISGATRATPSPWSVDALRHTLSRAASPTLWQTIASAFSKAVGYVAAHTGVPALVVAAVLLVVGYRILKRTARFAVEVAVVAAALLVASQLGWLRW